MLAALAESDGRQAHRVLVSWDSQWYAGIARNGYGFVRVHEDGRHLSDYAFFPLYPLLERALAAVTGLAYVDAGLVLSWVASIAAAWAIFAVADRLYGRRTGILAVVLWAALPISIVVSMAYSEALFTALAGWALYGCLTRRWLLAGALALLAGMTRPIGVAVIAAVVVAVGLALVRHALPRERVRMLVGAMLAPLGLVGYLGWVGQRTGSVAGYFRVTDGWGNGFDGGSAFIGWVGDYLDGWEFGLGLLIVAGVAVLVVLLVLSARERQPPPLLVYAGLLVVIALTTSGYFGSKPRYLLPAFSLLFPVAGWLGRRSTRTMTAVVGLLVGSSVVYGGIWLLGAGPP